MSPDRQFDQKGSSLGNARRYFEWSNQLPPPPIWSEVEMPAMKMGIEKVLAAYRGSNVNTLDVGVGGGKVLKLLTALGVPEEQVLGIDIDPEILQLVGSTNPGIKLRQIDMASASAVEQLRAKAPFQLVTAHMVLNHLTDSELARAIHNCFDLLADGGRIVAMVPYPTKEAKWEKLEEHEDGYSSNEDAPWGGTVIYHHRDFAAYVDYFDLSGFYVNFRSFARVETGFPNRLLMVARKHQLFKDKLNRLQFDTDMIDRHNYLPNRRVG